MTKPSSSSTSIAFLSATAAITTQEELELPAALVWGPGNAPNPTDTLTWGPKEQKNVAWQLLSFPEQHVYVAKVLVPLLDHPVVQIRGMAWQAIKELAAPPEWETWGSVEIAPAAPASTAPARGGSGRRGGRRGGFVRINERSTQGRAKMQMYMGTAGLGSGDGVRRADATGTVLAPVLEVLVDKAGELVLSADVTTPEGNTFVGLMFSLLSSVTHNVPLLAAAAAEGAASPAIGAIAGSTTALDAGLQLVLPQLQLLVKGLVQRAVAGRGAAAATPANAAAAGTGSAQGLLASCKAALGVSMLSDLCKALGRESHIGDPDVDLVDGVRAAAGDDVRKAQIDANPAAAAVGSSGRSGEPARVQKLLSAVRQWQYIHRRTAAAVVAATENALKESTAQQQQVLRAKPVGLTAAGATVRALCNEMALRAVDWHDAGSIQEVIRERVLGCGVGGATAPAAAGGGGVVVAAGWVPLTGGIFREYWNGCHYLACTWR